MCHRLGLRLGRISDIRMNAISIVIIVIVVALVVLALCTALRKEGGTCSCGSCSKKGGCPYSGGDCHCGE